MGERASERHLFIAGAATFTTCLLILSFIVAVYSGGNVSLITKGFPLVMRVGLFAFLWMTTYWCLRRALRGLEQEDLLGLGATLFGFRAGLWGGVNGLLFWSMLLGLTVGRAILVGSLVRAGLIPTFWFFCFGLLFSFLIGATIALVAWMIVRALVWLAHHAVRLTSALESSEKWGRPAAQ